MADVRNTGNARLRALSTVSGGRAVLLDAVLNPALGLVDLYFSHDTPLDAIAPGPGVKVDASQTVGGAPWLRVSFSKPGPLPLVLDGNVIEVVPSDPEPDFLAGRNVALATCNGERVDLVLDWLRFHHATQGLNGAVILFRHPPGSGLGSEIATAVNESLAAEGLDIRVLIVQADHPLGHKELPAESHPYCAPDAPGKDRMEVPPADPWASPLAEGLYYEWARSRFLGKARAVANIDLHDLVVEADGQGIFDLACSSPTGMIALHGRHCFPWRLRDVEEPQFADHSCIRFDAAGVRRSWCVAPDRLPDGCVWRPHRIGGLHPDPRHTPQFFRFMALRHPTDSVSRIVPKSSLIEHPPLQGMLSRHFDYEPVRPPKEKLELRTNGRRTIVTTMKNEGPFILEWIAYHRVIGIDDFLIYTNDCTDGTDVLLDLLQQRGIVQHRDNPFRRTGQKPQHAALAAAESEPVAAEAEWVVCMDVDEFINIKCGDGTLDALFAEVGDANMIAMTWRLFGNSDVHDFEPQPVIRQFTRCAPELTRKPHQAWGFKTIFRNTGIFRKLGVHRPKGLKPQLWDQIRWVNGSGKPIPRHMYRNAWRSTVDSYGYDLVQLNHYAVRSAESFLVKRDRGRVNHVDRDQGLAYWFRMNNNADQDLSIQRMLPRLERELDMLLQDPDIAAAHDAAVQAHREKIRALRAQPDYAEFYSQLTGPRLEKLSRMHARFGANVFLQGPEAIPPEIVEKDPEEAFFFTIAAGETEH